MNRVEDFVKAGQAAQRAVDELTAKNRPSLAEISVAALAIGGQVGSIVRLLDDAAAQREKRRHTNAATLEQLARAQVRKLAGTLDAHFLRFTSSAVGSCYRCTCGYELRGLELVAFLETVPSAPASINCKNCRGIAVRQSS